VFQGRHFYDTYGVHLLGVLVDTKGDASVLWGSTDLYKELLETSEASAQQSLKDLEHVYGCVPLRQEYGVYTNVGHRMMEIK
jgi:hypothetical protein